MMRTEEASAILARMYSNATGRGIVVNVHLFGIQYAAQLRNLSLVEVVKGAEIPETYKTEIRKGINLAKYVAVL